MNKIKQIRKEKEIVSPIYASEITFGFCLVIIDMNLFYLQFCFW